MELANYLDEDLIFLNIPAKGRSDAVRYMARALCRHYDLNLEEDIISDINSREKAKSTAMGGGFAVPHARTDKVGRLYAAFARMDKGIDWCASDGMPVRYIFLIAGPSRLAQEYLALLSDISRIMHRRGVRADIDNAENRKDIIDIIRRSGRRNRRRGAV